MVTFGSRYIRYTGEEVKSKNVDSIEDKIYLSYHENDEDKVEVFLMWITEKNQIKKN